jgi:hypothetical protein
MKRAVILAMGVLAFGLFTGSRAAFAQSTFKIPFKFEAGGKPFPPGDYSVVRKADGKIILRQESKGEELALTVIRKLPQPQPRIEGPQLVFDMVGNFEPSYTEYVTDYLLSEVWLPGEDGLLVLETKGAHQHKALKGESEKK